MIDRQEHDRQVAGNSVCPECLDAAGLARKQLLVVLAEPPVQVQDVAGECLEQRGFIGLDAQTIQLGVGMRRGERGLLWKCRRVAIALGEIEHSGARVTRERREGQVRRLAGRNANTTTEADDGIEHRAHGTRERECLHFHDWGAHPPPAPEEPLAAGLPLGLTDCLTINRNDVRQPHLGVFGQALPPGGKQDVPLGDVFGLHEEVRKCGVRRVGLRGGEHDLRVRRHLDGSRFAAVVGERDAPHLGGVRRRHDDVEVGLHAAVAAVELGAIIGKGYLILVRLHASRLKRRRPAFVALDITQETVRSGVVARGVIAPPREGHAAPVAVTGSCRRDHDRITAVRQELRLRCRRIRRREPADR